MSKKSLPKPILVSFFSAFSSGSFMVSVLRLSLDPFWVSFGECCEIGVQYHCSACFSPVFPVPFVEETVFSPLSVLWILVDHIFQNLILGILFCSIGLFIYFCAGTILFVLLWPWGIVWNQEVWYLQLCSFFLRIVLDIQGLLWLHAHFRIVSSVSVKDTFSILMRIALNLIG